MLIVSHRRPQVTIVERTATGWAERECRGGERVALSEPSATFELDELYAGIALDSR